MIDCSQKSLEHQWEVSGDDQFQIAGAWVSAGRSVSTSKRSKRVSWFAGNFRKHRKGVGLEDFDTKFAQKLCDTPGDLNKLFRRKIPWFHHIPSFSRALSKTIPKKKSREQILWFDFYVSVFQAWPLLEGPMVIPSSPSLCHGFSWQSWHHSRSKLNNWCHNMGMGQNLSLRWGNNHPFTSYICIPSRYQGFDPSPYVLSFGDVSMGHVSNVLPHPGAPRPKVEPGFIWWWIPSCWCNLWYKTPSFDMLWIIRFELEIFEIHKFSSWWNGLKEPGTWSQWID